MHLRGFVDAVLPEQVRGWAMDGDDPVRAVDVFVMLDGELISETQASLLRYDLRNASVGTGKYGFTANFLKFIAAERLDEVEVLVGDSDGGRLPLPRFKPYSPPVSADATTASETLKFDVASDGMGSSPVFVLGSRRSGTSVITHGLLRHTRYQGLHEGHVFDLAALLNGALETFYNFKSDVLQNPTFEMMIREVPRSYFDDAIAQMFRDLAAKRFPHPFWLDKTPTPEMVRAAPTLAAIWPNARFIFMRRRALENVASQIRKFPGESFRDCCEWWAACMSEWLIVRDSLRQRAIEVDQFAVAREPGRVATMIAELLTLEDAERDNLARFFANERVERTTEEMDRIEADFPADWTQKQRRIFADICLPLFAPFGYTEDARYFVSSDPALRAAHV